MPRYTLKIESNHIYKQSEQITNYAILVKNMELLYSGEFLLERIGSLIWRFLFPESVSRNYADCFSRTKALKHVSIFLPTGSG